jgi:hypothetical protein
MTALGIAAVTVAHIWVISAGWMTYWPRYTSRYDGLADAFRLGQCSLLSQPDPSHLALPDPYDPVASRPYLLRPGVLDTILYNGKFYLCWGPTPAVLLVPIKLLTGPRVIGDQYLAYGFAFGATLFGGLLLRSLWGRFFADVPPWTLLLAIMTAGLSTPLPYTLARSAVYEAAILGGQCFLLAGLYGVCGGKRFPSRLRLGLAGTSWALAAGSRVSLAIALGVLSGLVVWRIVRHGWRTSRQVDFAGLAAFSLPLATGAVLLAAYNVARFGNWHEFGQRYQLTGHNNYHSIPRLFQPANAVPGTYSYLLRPLQLHNQFPFVEAVPGTFPTFIRLPRHYEYNEPIAGLLIVSPFIWLALIPVVRLISQHRKVRRREALPTCAQEPGGLNWVVLCLLSASLLGFAPVPFMLGSTMRYLCDLTPGLMILAGVGFWQRARETVGRGAWPRFRAIGLTLAGYSIIVGMLLGVTGYYQHFRNFHPHLFGGISYWARDSAAAGVN